MFKPISIAFASLILTLHVSAPARAGVLINFDSLESPGTGYVTYTNPFDLGEFRFASIDGTNGRPASLQQSNPFYNGSAGLTVSNSSNLLMTRVDGAAFSVASVDLDRLFGSNDVELIGQLATGGTVLETFTPDAALGNETVTLVGFQDITSLTFGAVGTRNFANVGTVDNIQIANATVPEPSSFAIFALAGISPVLIRRRKRVRDNATLS